MQFQGYRRPDGKVGIRNHVLILPSVVCANRVARGIAQAVSGAIWVGNIGMAVPHWERTPT